MNALPLGPDVPASVEGLRFLGDIDPQEPLFFETLQDAETHQTSRHRRVMRAWNEMLRAHRSPAVRARGVLALETYANG